MVTENKLLLKDKKKITKKSKQKQRQLLERFAYENEVGGKNSVKVNKMICLLEQDTGFISIDTVVLSEIFDSN